MLTRTSPELAPLLLKPRRLLRLIHSIPLPSAAPAAPEPSTLSTSPPSLHHTDHPNPHPHLPHPHAYHPRGASLPSSPTLPTQAAPSSTTTYIGPALAPVTGTCPTWQSASPSDLHGPSLIPSYPGDPSPHSHSQSQAALCYTAPCPAAAPSGPGSGTAAVRHAAAVAAARQLGERAAALWAACCALDLTAAVAAMERSGAGERGKGAARMGKVQGRATESDKQGWGCANEVRVTLDDCCDPRSAICHTGYVKPPMCVALRV